MSSTGGFEQVDGIVAATDAFCALDLTALSDEQITRVLQTAETVRRRLDGLDARVVAQVQERGLHEAVTLSTPQKYLIDLLRLSRGEATRRVHAARVLAPRIVPSGARLDPILPVTARALADGRASAAHGEAVRKVVEKIPGRFDSDAREQIDEILGILARSSTPEDITTAGIALLARLDPDGALPDERDRKARRSLRVGPQGADLMSSLRGDLHPATRAKLEAILAKWARPGMNNPDDPDSPRGSIDRPELDPMAIEQAAKRDLHAPDQRLHDAFDALCTLALSSGALGQHRGLPVTVIVTMTLEQLETGTGVATTATGGVVPVADALAMAEKIHPLLALFDHTGVPLHLGRGKRLASRDQRLLLTAWQRGCTRPGCDVPAAHCAVHHLREWRDGGATDLDNLALVCDADHARITGTDAGWTTTADPHGGRPRWTAPHLLDPTRTRRRNHRHHPHELLTGAAAAAQQHRPKRHRIHRRICYTTPTEGHPSATQALSALLTGRPVP
ncbi:HNH endonuclease signature motif containing protein [Rhodococcus chondri]|uniref:DUF222 domain-containing protein n=2 Tax=Rhodococcus chondri TaxID=3065941 RepID=A0ABU7JNU1_9NOCA|nr:DUF222 domain-containing protein [Rhodococcus sp. CC-R104]MEE2031480.1 DUF222 domain-containing protein [Rhodococcus sp. CC-R104]